MDVGISGLTLHTGYISAEEEVRLIVQIDRQPWLTEMKRRTQEYGFAYDFRRRTAHMNRSIIAMPGWLGAFSERLYHEGFIAAQPDQAAVNEYLPGQGISAHVDCAPCFGDTVLALSLGSTCVMQFTPVGGGEPVDVLLPSRSLLVMSGEARYGWKHAIPARKSDVYAGWTFQRDRRISVTFRKVVHTEVTQSPGVAFSPRRARRS
jgi:alkylated DNA repair dioxygenase AlkB